MSTLSKIVLAAVLSAPGVAEASSRCEVSVIDDGDLTELKDEIVEHIQSEVEAYAPPWITGGHRHVSPVRGDKLHVTISKGTSDGATEFRLEYGIRRWQTGETTRLDLKPKVLFTASDLLNRTIGRWKQVLTSEIRESLGTRSELMEELIKKEFVIDNQFGLVMRDTESYLVLVHPMQPIPMSPVPKDTSLFIGWIQTNIHGDERFRVERKPCMTTGIPHKGELRGTRLEANDLDDFGPPGSYELRSTGEYEFVAGTDRDDHRNTVSVTLAGFPSAFGVDPAPLDLVLASASKSPLRRP